MEVKQPKRQLRALTIKKKMDILNFVAKNKNMKQVDIAKKYNLKKNTLSDLIGRKREDRKSISR